VDPRAKLIDDLRSYSSEVFAGESPFYRELVDRMREDVAEGGPCWRLLEPYASEPRTEFFPVRALAGVHEMVLAGEIPELEAHYPSVGGDGDAASAWPEVRIALADHSPEVLADLRHPLQTNETSRCGALAGGFHLIAARTGMPLRVLELGSSAGLNLHFDRYRYEAGGVAAGPPDAAVRFVDYWKGGVPPLEAEVEVVERSGCDIDPIEVTTERGRRQLLSYVMPDDDHRIAMMRAAIDVAASDPVRVDRESADTWAQRQLAELPTGTATVLFHSIFWLYPPEAVRRRVVDALAEAGRRASAKAPLHWLRYEETADDIGRCELRLRSWPGGEDALLAHGRHHFAPVSWLAGSASPTSPGSQGP
jgi:hypothetical protein